MRVIQQQCYILVFFKMIFSQPGKIAFVVSQIFLPSSSIVCMQQTVLFEENKGVIHIDMKGVLWLWLAVRWDMMRLPPIQEQSGEEKLPALRVRCFPPPRSSRQQTVGQQQSQDRKVSEDLKIKWCQSLGIGKNSSTYTAPDSLPTVPIHLLTLGHLCMLQPLSDSLHVSLDCTHGPGTTLGRP